MTVPERGTDPASNPVLLVRDLHKSFGSGAKRKDVLRGLSLSIPEGHILSLLGANGAGKTTLVEILATLSLPSAGTAEVCGFDIVQSAGEVRELISLTGQFAAVDQELSGRENLIFFARLRGLSRRAARLRADELLERFRLSDAAKQLAGSYSGGMRRRLDIAASLIVEPRLLFLDEPTTGLDPLSRRELWSMVEELRENGVSILLTTQYLDEAERLADNIVLLRGGRSVLEGSPAQIRAQFGGQVCQLSLDSLADLGKARDELLPVALGIASEQFTAEGLALSFPAARGAEDLTAALEALRPADIVVNSVSLSAPSLDDVFLGLAFEADAEEPATETTGS